jgi:cyclopropane fatty-acyl-phospholipid synthase-like methyltransferase
MKAHERGYWLVGKGSRDHRFDTLLSKSIINYLKVNMIKSAIDLGCGEGHYVNDLNNNGINCLGYDGNPNTTSITNNRCQIMDLSKPQVFEQKSEFTISLEVAEHIPKQFEDIYIQNVHNSNTKGIILTWAIPGQGGHGHVNEQPNEYALNKFLSLGYKYNTTDSNILRNNAELWWFKKTIMVLEK